MVTDINSEMIAGGPRLLDFQWEETLSSSAWAARPPSPHQLVSAHPSLLVLLSAVPPEFKDIRRHL